MALLKVETAEILYMLAFTNFQRKFLHRSRDFAALLQQKKHLMAQDKEISAAHQELMQALKKADFGKAVDKREEKTSNGSIDEEVTK
jgi:hypothetical protein